MKSLQLSFQGSPQKFGSAACCDLVYTESKLYNNVLFKDLISFKDVWTHKSQVMALQALYSHLEDFLRVKMQQKDCIISTQKHEIEFLRTQNDKLTQKNLQRTKKLLKSHQTTISKLLTEKQEQVTIIQSQKQLLQNRIVQLEKELQQNAQLVNGIERERQQMQTKEKRNEQLTTKLENSLKELQKQVQRLQKEKRQISSQLNDQKLQLQLKLKRQLAEVKQQNKHEIQDTHSVYKLQVEKLHQQILRQSVQAKETLNRTIDRYEGLLNEVRQKNCVLQESIQMITKQRDNSKLNNESLLKDIAKQDDLLDTYESYLKTADSNLLSLNQQLTETQLDLQHSKHTLQKHLLQKQSLLNTIKICEQQAKKWRQSYYLTKSRLPDII